MRYDVFISYSKQDRGFVQQLTDVLDVCGYTHSVDAEGIGSGEDFTNRLFDTIENSSIVLCVVSKSSIESKWVINEIAIAQSLNKSITLINIDGSCLTGSLFFYVGNLKQIRVGDQIESEIVEPLRKMLNKPKQQGGIFEGKSKPVSNSGRQSSDDYVPKKMDVDIFISYRRVDGRDWARNVMQALKINGYPKVFFDYHSIRDGVFNTQILDAIYSCQDFILIISPLALKKCANEDDWVSKEIREALKYGKKIIPVVIEDTFLGWPSDFPKDLYPIKSIQFSKLRTDEFFEDSIDKLTKRLSTKAVESILVSHVSSRTTLPQHEVLYTYKIKASEDCNLYIDDDFIQCLTAHAVAKISLPGGEYIRKVVSKFTSAVDEDVLILDRDKVEMINFQTSDKSGVFGWIKRRK